MHPITRRLTLFSLLALVVAAPVVAGPARASLAVDTGPLPAAGRLDDDVAAEWLDDDIAAITRTDITGQPRTVHVQIRRSTTSGADPVVVWSHGGSGGRTNPTKVGTTWGQAFTRSGFTFVAIAHPSRVGADRDALCAAVGASPCDTFNPLHWDRPHDVAWVIDWLTGDADTLGVDPDRIIQAGHSAGAFSVVTSAGAAWPLETDRAPTPDPRPIAFIAASPPGAEARGYDDTDLAGLDRPLLFLTGAGDTTAGTAADDRRATFDRLPTDAEAFLLWIDDERARHGVFDLDSSSCRRAGGTRAACRTLVRTVGGVAIEFAAEVTGCDGLDPDRLTHSVTGQLRPGMEWESTSR